MSKKIYTTMIIIGLMIIGGFSIRYFSKKSPINIENTQCQVKEMIFYYADWCPWCQKVKNEGTIKKIKELGIRVNEINIDKGPVNHQFHGIPTFVINEKIYSGYKTFEELRDLLGCPKENSNEEKQKTQAKGEKQIQEINFLGTKGGEVILEKGRSKNL